MPTVPSSLKTSKHPFCASQLSFVIAGANHVPLTHSDLTDQSPRDLIPRSERSIYAPIGKHRTFPRRTKRQENIKIISREFSGALRSGPVDYTGTIGVI